jgi:conjugal transfer/entry exclusion protein
MKKSIVIFLTLIAFFLVSDANAQTQDSLTFPIEIKLSDSIFKNYFHYKILNDSVADLKKQILQYQTDNQFYNNRVINLRYDFRDTYYTRYTFTFYLPLPHFRKKLYFY